ncbi:MAG: 3-deoxy-manno-octulosonate cytidylyltransferase [candidate division Zixibacteria bacterium]|nr:3-deoxy-manno-octulosonate cytidylyltransferase [candidate division Zixibacteria bacterium]
MTKPKIIGIIPARYSSKRLPGKPLIQIEGKPLVQRVYESAKKSSFLDRVIVATDSARISDVVYGFGGEAYLSLRRHPTGTDRVAEVVRNLNYDLVLNIQCDQPFLNPKMIDDLVTSMFGERNLWMGTLAIKIEDPQKLKNPNVVKVVLDQKGFALYFSRFPIPYLRDPHPTAHFRSSNQINLRRSPYYEHIGIYAFRKDFLLKFASWRETPLEKYEKLEQLRALENGYRIKVCVTRYQSFAIDSRSDLIKLKGRKREFSS